MDRKRWAELRAIVERALDHAPDARGEYLADACNGDAELRAEVEELLRFESGDSSFGVPTPLRVGRPEQIGPYRILGLLGEGGFGSVYRAEQTEPVRRQVALKLLRPGLDSKDVLARFDAERHALARMNHPNIARVFDAGETTDGRPFFAMELADGDPITTEADRRGLTLRQRLELFLPVCRAIQHSHTKGVVHRDLTPSNNLVVEEDGRPAAKVIDFGIAKATGGKLGDFTIVTHQQIIGTPAYMSPEQADPRIDVDNRTDVYSLGAVLYELLTGVRPFDDETLMRDGPTGLPKVLAEQEPTRPSTRVRSASRDDTTSRIGVDARALSRRLSGDLDWILLRALEKDRDRRYQTPQALADDLDRCLRDEPVSVGPPSAAYKLRKMARRHRLALAIAAALVAALSVGLVFAVVAWRDSERSGQRAQQSLYFAEMNLAGQSVADNSGVAAIRRLLERWTTPGDGFDPRGWEYRFLDRIAHGASRTASLPSLILDVAVHPTRPLLAVAGAHVFLLDTATGESVRDLPIESGFVSEVAWSPSGDRLAAATRDGVFIWSSSTWEELLHVPWTANAGAVSWHPDGIRIAYQQHNGHRLVLANSTTGDVLHEVTDRLMNDACTISFNADGTRLAFGGAEGIVFVYDVESWTQVAERRGHRPPVHTTAFSSNGWLATCGVDTSVRIWPPDPDRAGFELTGHDKRVIDVAWADDGRLVSTSWDYSTLVWDVAARLPLERLRGPNQRMTAATWDPRGDHVYAATERGVLSTWRVGAGGARRLHREIQLTGPLPGPYFEWLSNDLIRGSSGQDGHAVWRRGTGIEDEPPRISTDDWATQSTDGSLSAGITVRRDTIVIRDWPSGAVRREVSIPMLRAESTLAWHPTEHLVLCAGTDQLTVVPSDDGPGGWRIAGDGLLVRDAAWSPDGDRIVVGIGATVRLFRRDGSPQGSIDLPATARAVAWSPDGREVAAACADQICRILDAETLAPLRELRGHSHVVRSVSWHPDGTRIVTGADDGTVRLWEAATGQPILTLDLLGEGNAMALDWSPDGECLAVMTDWAMLELWDAVVP